MDVLLALREAVAEMPNEEVNARVAIIDNHDENWVARHPHLVKDYCGDLAAGMPLVIAYGIGTKQNYTNNDWLASPRLYDEGEATQVAGTLLRAAMQTLILLDALRTEREATGQKQARVAMPS